MVYWPLTFTTLTCHQSGFPVARFRRSNAPSYLSPPCMPPPSLHATPSFRTRPFFLPLHYGYKGCRLKRIPLLLSSRYYPKNPQENRNRFLWQITLFKGRSLRRPASKRPLDMRPGRLACKMLDAPRSTHFRVNLTSGFGTLATARTPYRGSRSAPSLCVQVPRKFFLRRWPDLLESPRTAPRSGLNTAIPNSMRRRVLIPRAKLCPIEPAITPTATGNSVTSQR